MMKDSTKISLSLLIVLFIAMLVPYGVSFDTVTSATSVDVPSFSATDEVDYADSGDESINVADNSLLSGDFVSGDMDVVIDDVLEENEVSSVIEEIPEPSKVPSTTPTPTPTAVKKLTSNTPYYIKVNKEQNVVTIYTKDSDGNYSIPYKAMTCSVGTATPAAGKSYKVTYYKKRWNALIGGVYGQYATQIVGDILFHSVPYTARDASALEYWEYDKLGTFASAGCVRLTVIDAKWIYDNIEAGTIVEFYNDANPGPLGKPATQLISQNERCRGWDPTDPDENNLWNIPEPEIDDSPIENVLEESPSTEMNWLESVEEVPNI